MVLVIAVIGGVATFLITLALGFDFEASASTEITIDRDAVPVETV